MSERHKLSISFNGGVRITRCCVLERKTRLKLATLSLEG